MLTFLARLTQPSGQTAALPKAAVTKPWWYESAMQLLGGSWFLLLWVMSTINLWVFPSPHWPSLLSRIAITLFYLLQGLFILTRLPAKAHARGLSPRMTAFVGTYLPWAIPFFKKLDEAALDLTSIAFVLVGITMALVAMLHLGRSFSLTPQARSVVRTGPYRWIRHPLYLSEEIAVVGAALPRLAPATVLILVLHIGVQVRRILYEEDLLRRTCPEYSSYASSRWRLVPYLW